MTCSVVLFRDDQTPPHDHEPHRRHRIAAGTGWSITGELGTGATSRVYLATRAGDGERMVVKVMKSGAAAAERSQYFLLEMQILQKMSHPNVVPITDAGEAQGVLFFAMPFIEGETMRQRLAREGAFPMTDAVRIARTSRRRSAHVHSHGVVHRDVKPENILLSPNGAVLLDFGHARAPAIMSSTESARREEVHRRHGELREPRAGGGPARRRLSVGSVFAGLCAPRDAHRPVPVRGVAPREIHAAPARPAAAGRPRHAAGCTR